MSVMYPHNKLPIPLREGFSKGAHSPFKSHKMDDGHTLMRRRFRKHALKFTLNFEFTFDQFAFFEAFVKYDMRGGVEWLEIDINGTGELRSVKFTKNYESSFVKDNNKWEVSVECMSMTPDSLIRPIDYIAAWPSELPYPEAKGYTIKAEDYLSVSSTPDAGAQQSRVRFQTRWDSFTCRWIMTPEQLAILDKFLVEDVAHGHSCFAAPFANGSGTKLVRARFITYPKATPESGVYQVDATLETCMAPILSRVDYNALK